MQPLSRRFFQRDAVVVARDLLGRLLVHEHPEGTTTGRIVETEAYAGPDDRAAHVAGGRFTPRTKVFWEPGGAAYVYLIYGMHHCFNVVTGRTGEPSAVLVRAVAPLSGLALMAKRRNRSLPANARHPRGDGRPPRALVELTSGPGRLADAFGLDRGHTGQDVSAPPLYVARGRRVPDARVESGPRVGVDYAGEDAHLAYRFFIRGDPFVSRPWSEEQKAAVSRMSAAKR